MKKFLMLFALFTQLFVICSCSKSDVVDKKVALILPSGEMVSRWTADANFLTQALKSYGCEVKLYTAEETQAGAAEQVKQIEEALKAGYKHFVITPIDFNEINKSGLLQSNQKCDFISYDRMIMNNEAVDFYVTCDPSKIGEMQAQFLLQSFRASGKTGMTIEYFAGPASDRNAEIYFSSAYELLAAEQNLTVASGKKAFQEVTLPSWSEEDAKAEMLKRLESIDAPDLILAPNDNVADGIISALIEKGCTTFPVITGQDLSDQAKVNIKAGKQTMTIYKEYEELARNAATVVNSFVLGSPVSTGKTFNNSAKEVPSLFSNITLVTKDNIDKY